MNLRFIPHRSRLALLRLISALTFFFCLAGFAHAQQQTISVQGGGSMTFTMTAQQLWCDSSHIFYIREWDFTNFVYTDTNGNRFSMPGTASGFQVTGDNRDNCPAPPPNTPLQLRSQGYVVTFTPGPGYGSAALGAMTAYLSPKYLVLAVTYAPPGSRSNVTYSNSTAQGTSTAISKTFTDQTSLSVTMGASVKFGIFNAGTSATASTSYTQEKDSSTSVSLNSTTSYGRQIPGPASSALGVDHRYDVIWVWLNPVVNISINPDNSLNWNGFSYDSQDINEMDVVPLYVSWLQNPSTMPADVANALARTWDSTGSGGLTNSDYVTILARDPLAGNASFNPNTDTSGRFDLEGGQVFNYSPPPAGGQPITETYSIAYQSTSSTGQGASDTYSVGLAVDAKFNTGLIIAKVDTEIKLSNTATWVNKWSSTATSTVGQTAALSITGPATSDNYTGPTRFQVWKDNVYGTFMFYPTN